MPINSHLLHINNYISTHRFYGLVLSPQASRYFKIFDTKPAGNDQLDEARNNAKLKHAMMAGASIWNSLTSDFQLELLGQESIFARDNEYNGIDLRDHIWMEINPSTKVGACTLKDEIKSKTLEHFGNDVKSYNCIVS